jgi:hypothetical protein
LESDDFTPNPALGQIQYTPCNIRYYAIKRCVNNGQTQANLVPI